MSKTDKTRPWHVRVAERPGVTCVPRHDHTRGECTLPADPSVSLGSWKAGSCRWEPTALAYYGPGAGCGCGVCAGTVDRRLDRRRERRGVRQVLNDAVRCCDQDPDVGAAGRRSW